MDKPVLLYILAPSYSGSTLLTFLLARHPDIATIGELNFNSNRHDLTTYRCSCGELLVTCPFWDRVEQICDQKGVEFSVERFDTSIHSERWVADRLFKATYRNRVFSMIRAGLVSAVPGVAGELRDRLIRIREVGRAICHVQSASAFLDGSKNPTTLDFFVRSKLWNIKVIHLTRDGRGVACSNMSHRSVDFHTAVLQWKKAATHIYNLRSTLPADVVMDVKYEDLCRDPKKVISAILTWAGLSDVDLITPANDASTQHILGNKMRLTFQSDIRLDERWQRSLGENELSLFNRRTGKLNRLLGYSQVRHGPLR